MRIIRSGDVQLGHADHVFRQSPASGLLATLAFLSAGTAFALAGVFGVVPTVPAALTSATASLLGLIAAATYRSQRRSDSWLLAINGKRIFVNLRSHLNRDTPDDAARIVELDADDVAGFCVTQGTVSGDTGSGSVSERTMFLDIVVKSPPTTLADALQSERARDSTGVVWRHYPVTLPAADTLRIAWRGKYDRVLPRIEEAVRALSMVASRLSPRHEHADLGTSGVRPVNANVEREIALLAQQGKTIEATVLAVRSLGMKHTEAREYVGRLATGGSRQLRGRP